MNDEAKRLGEDIQSAVHDLTDGYDYPDLRAAVDRLVAMAQGAVRYKHERDHARAQLDRSVKILSGIHSLINPPMVTHDGKAYEFQSPLIQEQLQALSDRIRAIPDELDASRAGVAFVKARAHGSQP